MKESRRERKEQDYVRKETERKKNKTIICKEK